jgi:hypothetical protein
MLVGLMEFKFMVELTGSAEERELAELLEKLLDHLRDQIQGNYDTLVPLFKSAPAVDRTVSGWPFAQNFSSRRQGMGFGLGEGLGG